MCSRQSNDNLRTGHTSVNLILTLSASGFSSSRQCCKCIIMKKQFGFTVSLYKIIDERLCFYRNCHTASVVEIKNEFLVFSPN